MLVIAVYRAIFDSPSVKKITKVIWLYFNYLSTVAKKGKLTLLCSPDEKAGLFLLGEIEIAGNSGKWDERIHRGWGASDGLSES